MSRFRSGTHQLRHQDVGQVDERSTEGEAHRHGKEGKGTEAPGGRGHLDRWGQEGPVGGCQHDLQNHSEQQTVKPARRLPSEASLALHGPNAARRRHMG